MKVCISGAGIAGPSLAHWLLRQGHEPTLIEQAPQFRRGGYLIDFWGAAFEVADRMGISARLRESGYVVRELRLVNDQGRPVAGLDTEVMRTAAGGRFVSLPRGELASIIYDTVKDRVETLFANGVASVDVEPDAVWTRLADGSRRRFDLLIGADGLHSNVRSLCFPRTAVEERFMGYEVAAFEASGYRPRDENTYVAYAVPGKQVARFSMRHDRTVFLLVFASDQRSSNLSLPEQRQLLHRLFDTAGWECARIMEAMEGADNLYLDQVSQIRMQRWTSHRVALVGDAAYGPSLLAGEGCALSMLGAYVLAGELGRAGNDSSVAFACYEQVLRGFISGKQDAAARFASVFAPRTALGLAIRRWGLRAMRLPGLADLMMGRSLRDEIALPRYEVDTSGVR